MASSRAVWYAGLGDGGQQVEIEGTPDDGGRRRHVAGPRGQELGAGQHRVAQRVRHRGRLDRGTGLRRQGILVDGRKKLLDVQRDAVAALVDRRHHLGRHRPAERRAGHGSGLRQPQPRQPDLLGEPLADQAGPQVAHGQLGVELVAAVRASDQHRPGPEPAGQVAERVQAQLVGPVQILENQQHRGPRFGRHDQVGQVLHQQAAPVVRVTGAGGDLTYPRRQALAEAGQRRLGRRCQVAGQIQQQARERLHVTREGRPAGNGEAAGPGAPRGRAEQAGLADARLARDEQQLAGALRSPGQPGLDEGNVGVPADQNR